MQFNSIKLRGLGPFSEETRLDIDALPGPLVAVTGPNSAGKSTILGLLMGAIDREVPVFDKYQSLSELATSRESYVEVTVTNHHRYTIRQLIDKQTGDGSSVLMDDKGEMLRDEKGDIIVPDGKLKKFDAWARKTFKPQEVREVSIFAVQGRHGVFDLTGGDLKKVILRVRGIERYEALAKRAGEYATSYREQLSTLVARIKDERERGGDLEALTAQATSLRELVKMCEQALRRAEGDLEQKRSEAEEVNRVIRENAEKRQALTGAQRGIDEARARARTLGERLAEQEQILSQRTTIEAAGVKQDELTAQLRELELEVERVNANRAAVTESGKALRARQVRIDEETKACQNRLARSQELLAQAELIREAVAQLPAREKEAYEAEQGLEEAQGQLDSISAVQLDNKEERIGLLRRGHERIGQEPEDSEYRVAITLSSEALVGDDQKADEILQHPEKLRVAREAVRLARQKANEARRGVAETRLLADRVTALQAAETSQAEDEEELARLSQESGSIAAELEQQTITWRQLSVQATALTAQRSKVESSLSEVRGVAGKAAALIAAQSLFVECQQQLDAINFEIEKLVAELESLPQPGVDPASVAIAPVEAQVRVAQEELNLAERDLALVERDLTRAQESAARLEQLQAERKEVEVELSEWTRLEDDLGKKGIQALEVDAAGPELSELTNELLRECFGPRWTIEIATTRDSATGKREVEQCEVIITDHGTGRIAAAKSLCGGEKAIVGEAISSALSVMACRHAGIENPTLIRDESDAALMKENSPLYVQMLRLVADKIGAHKVLLISHNPEVWSLCDSMVQVTAEHRVEVVR